MVEYIAPHHKTERKTMSAIKYKLPGGVLTDFMVSHITQGHSLLGNGSQSRLFMTNTGKDLMSSKAAFNYYWDGVLHGKWCPLLYEWPSFKPSYGRTMFVEHVTAQTGNQPDLWDGPARCMGSSAKQWGLHYAPGLHARQMQGAADQHVVWGGGGGPVGVGGAGLLPGLVPASVGMQAEAHGNVVVAVPLAAVVGMQQQACHESDSARESKCVIDLVSDDDMA